MAWQLDWLDGLDHYANTTQLQRVYGGAPQGFTTMAGRFGGQALRCGVTRVSVSAPSWVTSLAAYFQGLSDDRNIVVFHDGGTQQLRLVTSQVGGDFFLRLKRGDGTILATGSTRVQQDVWHFIEFGAKIDNTAGIAIVRLNGITQIQLTNTDTQNSANASADRVELGYNGVSPFYFWDDWAIWRDPAGGDPALALPGELRVKTSLMVGDELAQWSRSAGTANYQNVDETTPNDDTDYNFSSTPGQEDRFVPQSITATGAIKGLAVFGQFRKDDAGTRTVKLALKSGVSVFYGPDRDLLSSYMGDTLIFEKNPDGNVPWTEAAVNAARPGYNLVA